MKMQITIGVGVLLCLPSIAPAGTIGLALSSQSWTGRCDWAIVGNSIPGGGGGGGAGINALPVSISNASWGFVRVVNKSIGGAKWTNVNNQITGDQVTSALTNSPRELLVVCGRNNLLDGFISNQVVAQSWPLIESNLNIIAGKCAVANANLAIGEVLPAYTNFQEWAIPGIPQLNAAYAGWCATNPYSARTRFVSQHDAFAVLNPVTGNMDWLNSIFHLSVADQLHLNQTAYNFWGPYLFNYIGRFYSDPPATVGGKLISGVVASP